LPVLFFVYFIFFAQHYLNLQTTHTKIEDTRELMELTDNPETDQLFDDAPPGTRPVGYMFGQAVQWETIPAYKDQLTEIEKRFRAQIRTQKVLFLCLVGLVIPILFV